MLFLLLKNNLTQVQHFGRDEVMTSDIWDDFSYEMEEITTETVETTVDEIKLAGKPELTHMRGNLGQFLESNRNDNNSLTALDCYHINGQDTNMVGFEFEREARVESKPNEQIFSNKAELAGFLNNIKQTHSISFHNKYHKAEWREIFLVGSALVPDFEKVT